MSVQKSDKTNPNSTFATDGRVFSKGVNGLCILGIALDGWMGTYIERVCVCVCISCDETFPLNSCIRRGLLSAVCKYLHAV